MSKLIIMCGLPRAGKTTEVERIRKTHNNIVVVSPDTVRKAIHGEAFIKSAEPFVWATVDTMVKSLLMDGHTVLVDATNTTISSRKKWVAIARELTDRPLIIIIVDTEMEVCMERTASGPLEEAIIRMTGQAEYPTSAEGTVLVAGNFIYL